MTKTTTEATKRSIPTSGNPKKKRKTGTSISKDDQLTRDTILNPIVERLLRQDKIERGALKNIVESSKSLLPWLTTNILKQRLKRRRQKDAKSKQKEIVDLTVPSPIPNHCNYLIHY